jgi:predicted transcriptional regulator
MTDERTLTVRIDAAERTRREARERIAAMERGEDIESRHVLVLEDDAALARLVSETNIELLRAIRNHEPTSMRETAALVERDHKEVHRNLTELETLGIVEFEREGRAKRPVVRFDAIEIDIPVLTERDETETDPATV